MLTTDQINDVHRLYWSEHWSIRRIERHLKMCWKTIRKYLKAPAQGPAVRSRASKLDPFKGNIAEWLEKARRSPPPLLDKGYVHLAIPGAQHSPAIRAQSAPATRAPPRLRAHGTTGRRKIRSRLGSLRRTHLLWRHAQALRLRPGGCPQPDAVCRVHPQPELPDIRPLSHPRIRRNGWCGTRDCLRQSRHCGGRTRRPPGPL